MCVVLLLLFGFEILCVCLYVCFGGLVWWVFCVCVLGFFFGFRLFCFLFAVFLERATSVQILSEVVFLATASRMMNLECFISLIIFVLFPSVLFVST